MENQQKGRLGEKIAKKFLEDRDFQIIGENLTIQWGEIDLIAEKNRRMHIIEVKYRTSLRHGRPEEAITRHKLTKLWRTAQIYRRQNKLMHIPWQMDVIAVLLNKKTGKAQIRYFPNISFDRGFYKR